MEAATAAPAARPPGEVRAVGRRAATVALMGAFGVSLLLAVPGLRGLVDPIGDMSPGWLAGAVALEFASCLSFVVVFRLIFDRLGARDARSMAWTTLGSTALLPGGGAGGLVIGGWLMRITGAPASWIVRRSSAMFVLTTVTSMAAVACAALMLLPGASGGDISRYAAPLGGAIAVVLLAVALPSVAARRRVRRHSVRDLVDGVRDMRAAIARPHWRLLGAAGYLAFDMAVLWATLKALGTPPPAAALVLGYSVGYMASTLPVPGGLGVLDGGLAAALVLYHVPADQVAAAVLVYHAIALWLPGLGGLVAYVGLRRRLVRSARAG